TQPLKSFKDRKFIQVDRDNFNDVLARMTPGVKMSVENTLADDGSQMPVSLNFHSMDDFEPGRIVQQVEPLRKLLETRDRLRDLLSKVDRSEDLEGLLDKVLQDANQLKKLSSELGIQAPAEQKEEGK